MFKPSVCPGRESNPPHQLICALITLPARQSRRHDGSALVGLFPTKNNSNPSPNWNTKHYITIEFCANLNVKPPPCTNVNPPAQTQSLPLTTFWRRFCSQGRIKWMRGHLNAYRNCVTFHMPTYHSRCFSACYQGSHCGAFPPRSAFLVDLGV